jgi:phosphohistidine phosphatase SixA
MLGVSIRALDIPIGELLSSPAYRARQTVILAGFGEPITEPELDEGGQGMQGAADDKNVAWLRTTVARRPRRGTNRLIVTHDPLIEAAFGKDAANLAPTETLILKPDGEGDAAIISRLKIEELRALAGK